MPTAPTTIVFRNNWFFIGIIFAGWLILATLAVALLITDLTEVFPLKGYNFDRLETIILFLSFSLGSATTAAKLWYIFRNMTHAQARLDADGVEFILGTKKDPEIQFFAWDQIASIRHKTSGFNRYYSVIGKDNRSIRLTIFNFFRPGAVAHHLAKATNQTIQKI
jgi:hypothetical protein